MDTLEMKDIEAAVEGILFASGEPVAVDRICVALNMDRPTVELVLQHLQDYYSYERRGMRLVRMEDSWQLCSAPEYGELIRKAFDELLEKQGVEAFGEVGDPFDPQLHAAVAHTDDESAGENCIAEVFQKGYRMGDRVLRYAMVKVAN